MSRDVFSTELTHRGLACDGHPSYAATISLEQILYKLILFTPHQRPPLGNENCGRIRGGPLYTEKGVKGTSPDSL